MGYYQSHQALATEDVVDFPIYGSPNSDGYEFYHWYSHPYLYKVPCVYHVDSTNRGSYLVQFGDCSESMSVSALDNLLKSSYGNFETNEETPRKVPPVARRKLGGRSGNELGRQVATTKLSRKIRATLVHIQVSNGEWENKFSIGREILKEDQHLGMGGNSKIDVQLFDKMSHREEIYVTDKLEDGCAGNELMKVWENVEPVEIKNYNNEYQVLRPNSQNVWN
ncbi:hypothetical protein RND71_036791 [Anisodus tanguticus]|uniref:Uncharacterized protein n=1 Tax=Anisodus tanguticus TaxID=243964 RepID=A0AAE1R4S7_9SOLA|nr:hypothetical protein RND71_036791 [Anisodus tanguticus]